MTAGFMVPRDENWVRARHGVVPRNRAERRAPFGKLWSHAVRFNKERACGAVPCHHPPALCAVRPPASRRALLLARYYKTGGHRPPLHASTAWATRSTMRPLDSAHILAKLVEAKRERLHKQKMRVPDAIARQMAKVAPKVPSFQEALESPQRVRIIAEVKKASPSKGVLSPNLNVEALATQYKQAGASAISVVTEEDYFQGDL